MRSTIAALALLASASAQAEICYGPERGFGTAAPPTNTTVFTCPTAGVGTVRELAARGWRIVKLAPVATSGSGLDTRFAEQLVLRRADRVFASGFE